MNEIYLQSTLPAQLHRSIIDQALLREESDEEDEDEEQEEDDSDEEDDQRNEGYSE
jgi:hypothetical protein